MTVENEVCRDESACIRLELCCDNCPEQNPCLRKQNATIGKEDLLCISMLQAYIVGVKSLATHIQVWLVRWYIETEEAANISLASRRQECLEDSSRPTEAAQGTFGFSSRSAQSNR